jgi:peptidoglycan/xylan/chitin deacetylase (PgdA/CDA1 family)
MTDGDERTRAVVCDACGAVDELGQEDTALRVADDHRRRQPDADEHDVVVLTFSDGADPNDFLEYLSRLVDKGGSALDVLDEHGVPTTKVNVVREDLDDEPA